MILRKAWFWRIMLVVYLAAVAYICFAGQGSLPSFDYWPFSIPADKCVHFLMFRPWPILACLAFMPGHSMVPVLLLMTLVGLALAGTTEWVQGLLPYRSKDVWDFIADCLGLLAGALLFAAFYLFLQRSGTRSARN